MKLSPAMPAVQAISKIHNMLKSATFDKTGSTKMTLDSIDGALYMNHIRTQLVTISEILMILDMFFVYHNNIWVTLG